MDLNEFCAVVDGLPEGISLCNGELERMYEYVGLTHSNVYKRNDVTRLLYKNIHDAFISGHTSVWKICKSFEIELIQNKILDNSEIDKYISIVACLRDAVRGESPSGGNIEGDWEEAIRCAKDHHSIQELHSLETLMHLHRRTVEVSEAAKRIRDRGYQITRNRSEVAIEANSEIALAKNIERYVSGIGGVNVARRIFSIIAPLYDSEQERFHIVRRVSSAQTFFPDVPYGYLLLLAAKHPSGTKSISNTDENWNELIHLATDYATIFDVQEYFHPAMRVMDATELLTYLRNLAMYDMLFPFIQLKGSDVERIARGILADFDFDRCYGSGWTINEFLEIVGILLNSSRALRGPVLFDRRYIKTALRDISPGTVARIFDEVLCHSQIGANQNFLKPTDAPVPGTPGPEGVGHDFFMRPLVRFNNCYLMLDRALCAPAYLEALFGALRIAHKDFDQNLGKPIEGFLRKELLNHQVSTLSGEYCVSGEVGEVDLAIETDTTIILLEIKKKALTRKARAGIDADVLIDLAKSLLQAQIQAGYHELRLRQNTYIELNDKGTVTRLALGGRSVECIAVTLLDYGSFQDRILLQKYLVGNLNASYSVSASQYRKSFDSFNVMLDDLRNLYIQLEKLNGMSSQPFFNCWFLSVPQLLIMLDNVCGPEEFRNALWNTRHITMGTHDFYFEHANMLRMRNVSQPRTS